jgi:retinol dehydrogenase 12
MGNTSTTHLQGNVCIVTGATSGIGKETALELARQGATMVLAVRNTTLGESVKQEIIQATGNANIDVMACDAASFASIMAFASAFKTKYDRLNILVNNAGIMERTRKVSRDGIELTFAVNHLAPFLLTKLLLPTLKASAPSRIVNVSSDAHRSAVINFDDLEAKQQFSFFRVYGQSKLANILFTRQLASLLQGTGVTANALHPGVVATKLFDLIPAFVRGVAKMFMLTPAQGAETSVYLASSPEVANVTGKYFSKKKIAPISDAAQNADTAERLWQVSEEYVSI